MLNYFNFRSFGEDCLLTNDFGSYVYLPEDEMIRLVRKGTTDNEAHDEILRERGFIFDESELSFSSAWAGALRCGKSYLLSGTSLHIIVVTTACNLECLYCQARQSECCGRYMDRDTALRAVDIALSAPSSHISIEFQGGEPLLNFEIIRDAVEHAIDNAKGKTIEFTVVSNLTLITDEMLEFFATHDVTLSTSLDGAPSLHNHNRPYSDGTGSYETLLLAIERVRKAGIPLGAIQTTTSASLVQARQIVDTYCSLGFDNVFIRPLTPLGRASEAWEHVGYQPEEFSAFYREVLRYIVDLNKRGIHIKEGHASIVLPKILFGNPTNYMELRSPCGAGIGQMAYHVDGNVFTCDEGRMLYEMGDSSFKLGNVWENSYKDMVRCSVCRVASVSSAVESVPGCCDCVYQPYCGLCPVVNVARQADLLPKMAHDYRCRIYMGIFDAIFDIIHNDEIGLRLMREWC